MAYENIKEATPPKVPGATEVIDNVTLLATIEAHPDERATARAKAGKALRLMAERL